MKRTTTWSGWCVGLEMLALVSAGCGNEDTSGSDDPLDENPDTGGQPDEGSSDGPVPRGPQGKPELGAQIDRMGRAAISTALIASFEPDETQKGMLKDTYNAANEDWTQFAPEMAKNLAILDGLDTVCGNQLLAGEGAQRYEPLSGVLAEDRLVVNSASGQCGVYLGTEAEAVGAVQPGQGGCGGRTPLDDVIERSYSLLAAGSLTGVDDTITKDDQVHDPNTFPFLAPPRN